MVGKRIPRYSLDGVSDAAVTVHPFSTEDGLGLELTRFRRDDCDDVVLLVPGLPASRDMFIMPEHRNLATFLLDSGFTDVWTLDFRMSNRFPYDTETHRYTLDDIAHYDHPAALAELRRHIGDRRVHVVAQCLGSVSFSMALAAGTVDGIASMTSNSVSLVIHLPSWSQKKLAVAPSLMEYVVGIPYFDPRHSDAPPFTRGWMLSKIVSLFHRECDVSACHMISFMWGSGHPGLWQHENLLDITHERIADLFGANGMNYYRHMHKMSRAQHAVRYNPTDPRHAELPVDYLSKASHITTPILFMTGDHNHVFTDSNIACHKVMSKATPGIHELEILPGYGHVDPFIGKNAHIDVFPQIVDFIKRKAV
jgi:pimeloyl-ACP methyl ester carboxylesterase